MINPWGTTPYPDSEQSEMFCQITMSTQTWTARGKILFYIDTDRRTLVLDDYLYRVQNHLEQVKAEYGYIVRYFYNS